MNNLAQLGLIYVYLLVIILLVGLGYAGFRLVNWTITKVSASPEKRKKASLKGEGDDPAWMRLAFLSAIVLSLAIFAGGMFTVIGIGGEGHDHNAHSQTGTQSAMNGPSQQSLSNQLPQSYRENQISILKLVAIVIFATLVLELLARF